MSNSTDLNVKAKFGLKSFITVIIILFAVLFFVGDGIYVIKRKDIVEIKQLQKISSDEYAVLSLNTKYEKVTCKESEFNILGKAVSVLSSSLL